jgi:hypothetical protein
MLPSTSAGLAFLPFTLGVGLLSRLFGGVADAIGARAVLIAGPVGAALAYAWLALAHEGSLTAGLLGPLALLGVSFAMIVAPLTFPHHTDDTCTSACLSRLPESASFLLGPREPRRRTCRI